MNADLLERYEALLNVEDRHQLAQLQRPLVRMNFLVSRALRNSLLAEKLQIAPQDLQVIRDENDKPQLRDFPDWHFNLSHCRDWVALAVSARGAVGIDVEVCDRTHNLLGIAKRFFLADEYALLASLPESQRADTFCNLWTLKEACVKWSGLGIGRALSGVGVHIQDEKIYWSLREGVALAAESPRARLLQLAPNARLAVVCAEDIATSREVFSSTPLGERAAWPVRVLATA